MNIVGYSGLHQSVAFKRRMWPHLSPREYRIAQGFDSAAALVSDGTIRAAAAEERFTRQKATNTFPARAIEYCLSEAGIQPQNLNYIAHNFDYGRRAARLQFQLRDPLEFDEVYSPEAQVRLLNEHIPGVDWETKFVPVPHHLAHAASAFFPSGFDEALILVCDGMGERESTTVAVGTGNDINIIKEVRAVHSLGILYGVFTLYLGFYMNLDEYKVMGLAPYGNPTRYFDQLMGLVHLQSDGTYAIPVLFDNPTREQQETYAGTLAILTDMFGPPRGEEEELTQRHMDIAAALQATLEVSLLHILQHFKAETGLRNLCFAGGVALNCTANGVIWRTGLFDRMFVQPAAGDDGSALGAALYVQHVREPQVQGARMTVPLWGPEFGSPEIQTALDSRPGWQATRFDTFDQLIDEVAQRLFRGEVFGWFQGRMEFGPRALGSRSILATPQDPGMRGRINRLVKQREEFRPFAPVVTAEAASTYFEVQPGDEPLYAHMLFVTQVRPQYQTCFPAITHVDGSARVQTVAREDNPRLWHLLQAFERLSGAPILLNTSFNVRGQPIVCTPTEAVDTFSAARLDGLVIGDYLVRRRTASADL